MIDIKETMKKSRYYIWLKSDEVEFLENKIRNRFSRKPAVMNPTGYILIAVENYFTEKPSRSV